MQKKILFVFVSLVCTLAFIISPYANAEVQKQEEEKEIEKVTQELEYYFGDSEVKDEEGNIVSYDYQKLKTKFTEEQQQELDKIEEEKRNTAGTAFRACPTQEACQNVTDNTECVINSLNIFDTLGPAALAEIVQAIQAGQYGVAGTKLVKMGVKGGAYGIAGSLAWAVGKCMANGNPTNGV
ncbi:hypothetical protein BU033_12805 [Staphylococcus simulans]|uniref:hypothetical protein n=1 Tax=Staphylococcus simulans TaxID=1286 RepID=UPI000E6A5D34|nr:hypothetical protein [Staphylococcus simulans]RIN54958.1 hypothetical protein BU033_12805 [Staphylococcus simulans]RIN72215.1 hypothetical protein BU028_12800 [Staphylococcus simulans]